MFVTILNFVVLGLSLAIPVGALTVEMIKQGIQQGFKYAFCVAFGGLFADFVFVILIFAGLAQFLLQPFYKILILILGFITLTYMGIQSIREGIMVDDRSTAKKKSIWECFLAGFLIVVTNPLCIVFWIAIYGSVIATIIDKVDFSLVLLYSSAIFVGLMLWDTFIASFIHFSRRFFSDFSIKILSVISGISLIAFAAYFGYELFLICNL